VGISANDIAAACCQQRKIKVTFAQLESFSETWPIKVEDMQRLERIERTMVRWMCVASLKNKVSSVDLNGHLGLKEVADVKSSEMVWTSRTKTQR